MIALACAWKRRWRPTGCSLLVAAAIFLAPGWAGGGEADPAFDWCSVPVEVVKLPPDAPFVPVSAEIDLGAIASQLGMSGMIDERSLRLYRILPDGSEAEEAVQFSPFEQPRAKDRQFLPDTVPNVSYTTERSAGDVSEGPKVAGSLSWIARADAAGGQRYRLRFGVARRGRMIQVPFSPEQLPRVRRREPRDADPLFSADADSSPVAAGRGRRDPGQPPVGHLVPHRAVARAGPLVVDPPAVSLSGQRTRRHLADRVRQAARPDGQPRPPLFALGRPCQRGRQRLLVGAGRRRHRPRTTGAHGRRADLLPAGAADALDQGPDFRRIAARRALSSRAADLDRLPRGRGFPADGRRAGIHAGRCPGGRVGQDHLRLPRGAGGPVDEPFRRRRRDRQLARRTQRTGGPSAAGRVARSVGPHRGRTRRRPAAGRDSADPAGRASPCSIIPRTSTIRPAGTAATTAGPGRRSTGKPPTRSSPARRCGCGIGSTCTGTTRSAARSPSSTRPIAPRWRFVSASRPGSTNRCWTRRVGSCHVSRPCHPRPQVSAIADGTGIQQPLPRASRWRPCQP